MQSRIKTLAILGLLLFLYNTTTAQDETIELCAGESLELNSEEMYDGTYFWEFSRDGENWIVLNHDSRPAFTFYPEEDGFYRLRIVDDACGIEYTSPKKQISVLASEEKMLLNCNLSSNTIDQHSEIQFSLTDVERYEEIAYHFNTGQTILSSDGQLTKNVGLEETEVYVTARSEGSCFVSNKVTWNVNPVEQIGHEEICGGYEISYERWLKLHPNPEEATKEKYYEYLRIKEERFEKWMEEQMAKNNSEEEEEVLTIPVIFHLIGFEDDEENGLSDLSYLTSAIIEDQLAQVNADFRRLPNSPGFNDNSAGADTKIQFCLTTESPEDFSLTEPGINRVSAIDNNWENPPYTSEYIEVHIKPTITSTWSTLDYLNVFVIGGELVKQDGSFYPGYAKFPEIPLNTGGETLIDGILSDVIGTDETDGVVVRHNTIGSVANPNSSNTLNPFSGTKYGRVLTHEIGHFLGLRHTSGDPAENEEFPCNVDDYCHDTPRDLDNTTNNNCSTHPFTCFEFDMIENYMDYTLGTCMNIFTQEQKQRMRLVLNNSTNRVTLHGSTVECIEPFYCSKPYNISHEYIDGENSGILFTWNLDIEPVDGIQVGMLPTDINSIIFQNVILEGSATSFFVGSAELSANETYTVKITSKCSDEISSEPSQYIFSTFDHGVLPCESPYPQVQNLSAEFNTTTYGANLTWNGILGSNGVQIRIRPEGTSNWQSGQIPQADLAQFHIPNTYIQENTSYQCQVRAGCNSNGLIIGPWSEIATFQTGTFGEVPCELPYPQVTGLNAQINQNEDGFLLTWNAIQGSIGCQIEYGPVGFPDLLDSSVTIGSDVNGFILDESLLFPNQNYQVRVACGCQLEPEVAGPYSEYTFFNSADIGSLSGNETYPPGSVHCLPGGSDVIEIINQTTGRTWMDRNLGASQIANSSTDQTAYGDLYQWGRFSDGHQCRNSEFASSNASSHQPDNSFFYANSNGNWIDPDFVWLNWSLTTSLWDPPSLVNNPCPSGFTVPTVAEWTAEVATWSSIDVNGSYSTGSPLRLTLGGARYSSSMSMEGVWGFYWSRNATESSGGDGANALLVGEDFVQMSQNSRSTGASIRCIKESDETGQGCIQPFPETTIQGAYAMLDGSGIRLEWNPPEFTTFCEVEYRISGSLNSTNITVQGNEVDQYIIPADELLQMTDYEFRIRSGCEESSLVTGPWSNWNYFYSNDIGEPVCQEPLPETPIQGAYAMLNGSGIRLQWYPPENTSFCELQYKEAGTFNNTTAVVDNGALNQYIVPESELMQDTDYDWRVRCGCSQEPFTVGPWSNWQAFFSGSIGQGPPPEYPGGSVHCFQDGADVVQITNPSTGKTWMDRNLGATQVATSYTDQSAYGDLYQWGRFSDGHQCRNSSTTSSLSSSISPTHDDFILASDLPRDWLVSQNDNLWQGENGANNPCPSGYRVPTETELNNERQSWSSNNSSGAFNSPLKLTGTGYRSRSSGGLIFVGSDGTYRSSTVSGSNARLMYITGSNVNMVHGVRADGNAVRCIKD